MFSETNKTAAADKGKAAEKRGRTDGPNTQREPTPVPHEELGTSGLQKYEKRYGSIVRALATAQVLFVLALPSNLLLVI